MADVQAFRAFRYDLGRVGALGDVVAPPYDVIDEGLQQALYARSPYNVIRLILNKENPADTENDNRYTRAAQTLKAWQHDNILVQDSARALPSASRRYSAARQVFLGPVRRIRCTRRRKTMRTSDVGSGTLGRN